MTLTTTVRWFRVYVTGNPSRFEDVLELNEARARTEGGIRLGVSQEKLRVMPIVSNAVPDSLASLRLC